MDLSGIAVLDHHAHGLLRSARSPGTSYAAFFTEARDPEQVTAHVPRTFSYRRTLREVAQLLGVEPTEAAIAEQREALGVEAYARKFFEAARLDAVFLDDGFAPDELEPVAWHERFFPAARILRLEAHAEGILARSRDLDAFDEAFRASIDPPPAGVVAFKSIAAYRTGLDIRPAARQEAAADFRAYRAGSGRLAQKALLDHMLGLALEIAARREMPVQFHTGFGDRDLDLRLANPLHLRAILEDERFHGFPLVLLHAAYPFTREGGYLAATYSQVYLDFGLAIPLLSTSGMERVVEQLFELGPASKVMYSSDAHHVPELYYLAARHGREALGNALDRAVGCGDLTVAEAGRMAGDVLRGNAARVYRWAGQGARQEDPR
jgi:uncharacterized protein